MTNIELSFLNFAENLTTKVHNKNNSRNLEELKKDINEVGIILNNTKNSIEEKLNISIVTPKNNINITDLKK